ncbi:M1 family aminopeptidase [Hymenobacter negativus]|uniref:Peptidase M1 membrane alanine aminopeptidase domain-containing protein n=1 Tax=Hymenobacter negativus TaxID=2795026 RepID=A0ABS3QNU7_9BACT|nr:M1 family aminopeptidase [Hymenobacter negativus]MBO2012964.1 hypothetical protein [Hymenobacter negativus]
MRIEARLPEKNLQVQGTFAFDADDQTRDSVDVVVNKNMGRPTFRLLSPKQPQFVVKEVPAADGQAVYRFLFSPRLVPHQTVRIGFAYQGGTLPAAQFFLDSAYCMAGGYGVAWYPQVLARQADNSTSTMEGTGTIRVTTARRFTPVIMGSQFHSIGKGKLLTTEFTVRTPAIFSLFVGHYIRSDYSGPLPIGAYRLTRDTVTSAYVRKCARIIEELSQEFGPYAFGSFNIVEYPDEVAAKLGIGGISECAGIALPSASFGKPFNYALFGYELGHQWWGNAVRSTGKKGTGILSEAMAQYGSLQVVKRFDPTQTEQYRRTGYPGYNKEQSGLGYLTLVASGSDTALQNVSSAEAHSIGDSKGFLVLELLAETIGKERMRAALHHLTTKYRDHPLTWENFLNEIQQAAGQDLAWFYEQWLNRTGAPEWTLSWQLSGQGQVALKVVQPPRTAYRLRLDAELISTAGKTVRCVVEVAGATTTLRQEVPPDFIVQQVRLDPEFKVLHWSEEYRARAMVLADASRVRNLWLSGKVPEALAMGEAALAKVSQPDPYGAEFALCFELGFLQARRSRQSPAFREEAIAYFLRAVRCPVREPQGLTNAYLLLAKLAQAKGDKELFAWARSCALTADALTGNAEGVASRL